MRHVVDPEVAAAFLRLPRIAVVGASDDKSSFGGAILRALLDHGIDAVPVNRRATEVAGRRCYADLREVPGTVDGVLVMVARDAAADVVRTALATGIRSVWLFKGIGAPGSVSDEAIELCRAGGATVVPGACPMMFLDPVRGGHRFHRTFRRMKGAVGRPSEASPAPVAPAA